MFGSNGPMDSTLSFLVSGSSASGSANGTLGVLGDAVLTMPISREATTTFQRLVGFLREEGGEMYSARAPEVISPMNFCTSSLHCHGNCMRLGH